MDLEIELNKIMHADCMDIMADIPDNGFDLAIVDPPYGIGIHKMNFVKSGRMKIGTAYRRDYTKTKSWDSEPPDEKYFNELLRISKSQIIWGGNYFTNFLPVSKSWIIWDKRTHKKYNNDFADCELAWSNLGVARIFRFLYSGMLQENMKNKENRFHPTQKPVALYRWLLQNYAKEGDIILDTHSGSGSLACACHLEKFDFIAIEKDVDYFNDSVLRFEEMKSQGLLF